MEGKEAGGDILQCFFLSSIQLIVQIPKCLHNRALQDR
ncbi:hypothetical protein DOT_3589 [Desulfosporosinus sp. OT]|nr:hypothetical protein DOT_3589 [Desulfosporosinus sp. OT]